MSVRIITRNVIINFHKIMEGMDDPRQETLDLVLGVDFNRSEWFDRSCVIKIGRNCSCVTLHFFENSAVNNLLVPYSG